MIEYASEKYLKVQQPDIEIETNYGENGGGSKDHNLISTKSSRVEMK